MRIVSKDGVTTSTGDLPDVTRDPPGRIGLTQEMFLSMDPPPMPVRKGVFRFKCHEDMNRDSEESELRMVLQARRLRLTSSPA